MTEYKCYLYDYFSQRVDFIFLDTNSVIKNVLAVFQYYGNYSKKGLAKALESELHGKFEDCVMTLGKETSLHFSLCVCGCVREIVDMLNASVIERLFSEKLLGSLFFQLCLSRVGPVSIITQTFITQRYNSN